MTVGDVLAGEARFQLAEKGIQVIPQAALAKAIDGQVPQSPQAAGEIAARAKLDALALYLEIRRWEPDAPTHPAYRHRRGIREPRRPGERQGGLAARSTPRADRDAR